MCIPHVFSFLFTPSVIWHLYHTKSLFKIRDSSEVEIAKLLVEQSKPALGEVVFSHKDTDRKNDKCDSMKIVVVVASLDDNPECNVYLRDALKEP